MDKLDGNETAHLATPGGLKRLLCVFFLFFLFLSKKITRGCGGVQTHSERVEAEAKLLPAAVGGVGYGWASVQTPRGVIRKTFAA